MNSINKTLLSGLFAGLIILVTGLGLVPLIGDQMHEVLKSHNAPPLGIPAMIFFAAVSLINGVFLMALYVLLKDRFTSNKRALFSIVTCFWLLKYVLSNMSLVAYGFMPLKLSLVGTVWGFYELLAGCIVGINVIKKL